MDRNSIRRALQASCGKIHSQEKKTVQKIRHEFSHLQELCQVFATHS